MKVLIDISEDYYELIKNDVENHTTNYVPFLMIGNGIPLNGTNGDVLKAVFPNVIIVEDTEYDCLSISNDFWNAEYKAESEE